MATVTVNSNFAFDYTQVDLNWYSANFDSMTLNGAGTTLWVFASDAIDDQYLTFGGQGITVANDAVTAGTITSIAESDRLTNTVLWQLSNISVSAVAIYNSALTASNSDELSLIATAMSGNDAITLSGLGDHANGFAGNDTIIGNGGDDYLEGGDGNDTLDGGSGADTLDGGNGLDTVGYAAAGSGLVVSLANPASNTGIAAGDVYYSIEGAIGSGFADTLTGDGQDNYIYGGGGNDVINGGPGNDTLEGGAGADTLTGGGGTDAVTYLNSTAAVTIDLANPAGRTGDAAGDVYIAITNFGGSRFADTFIGDAAANNFGGGAGNDTFEGAGGNDVALYSTARSTWTVTRDTVNHKLILADVGGTDTTRHVEQFQFSDGLYSFSFSNPGAAVVANFNPAQGWGSQNLFPRHLADVNGDGFVDIVGFGIAGVLVSFGSANGFATATLVGTDFNQSSGWTTDDMFHRVVVDVNHDGRADIVGFGYAGAMVSLAKADGTYNGPITAIGDFGLNQGWANMTGFNRTVADVNGDGFADIVGFGFAGTLVALGNGNGTFQPVKTAIANFGVGQGWGSDLFTHRTVADVNGDGRADIVGFGNAGTWVALARTDGTFADAQMVLADFGTSQGWTSNDTYARHVADVNGDHVGDIVGFGIAGTLVAYGNGDGTFTKASTDLANFGANQGWTSDTTYHREVIDMNRDGLADIVGFGIAGVLIGLNQSDFLV